MASPGPTKSQPLHNFDLPCLKWNKDGQSSGHQKRRRTMKSPTGRQNASSASPLLNSPLRDSVSATPPPPRLQSPLGDSKAISSRESPVQRDYLMKQSSVRGESSKPLVNREGMKQSPAGDDSERLSFLRDEALRHFHSRDSSLEAERLRKGKGPLIEYRRNHSRSPAFDILKNGVYSSNSKQPEEKIEKKSEEKLEKKSMEKVEKKPVEKIEKKSVEKVEKKPMEKLEKKSVEKPEKKSVEKLEKKSMEKPEKKSKATETDVEGVKRSKILFKIPCKNNKPEEGNQKEGLVKADKNDEHGETHEVQEEGKADNEFDEDTKIWNLRPRKPKRKKATTVGGEKGNVSGSPDKNKTLSQLKNAYKSGGKEGKSGGSGGDKEKGEKKEKKNLSISISLSKEEIEEDIFALTGSKPSRRPKKRAKNVQKHLDVRKDLPF